MAFKKNNSILITGGTGFIGSHTCVSLIEDGFEIIVVDSNINSSISTIDKIKKSLNSKKSSLTFFQGDVRDLDFLRKVFVEAENTNKPINAVIHFAGLKSIGDSVKEPILYWDSNVNGSLTLFKVMQEFKCKNIVFSSSAAIYKANNKSLEECSEIKPINPYGNTKSTIETILKDIFNSDRSWRIANLRYFNPIGAHPKGFLGEEPVEKPNNLFPYICGVAKGKYKLLEIFGNDWFTPDGTGVRDYIHVLDLAEAHKYALDFLLDNEPQIISLNIGTGKGTSVLELVKLFENVNKCKVPFAFTEKRKGDCPYVVANCDLAMKLLNWNPKRDLVDMCKDGWEWEKKTIPSDF